MERFRRLIASDIPFARDDANRLLPLMVGCLTAFVALLLALAMSISAALSEQSYAVVGGVQIEVPRAKAADAAFLERVRSEVAQTQGVRGITILSEAQMEKLLKPWLGEDFSLTDLPVPVILDVTTDVKNGKTAVDTAKLSRALAAMDTNIRVQDRGPWIHYVLKATGMLQGLVLIVALLLLVCVIGMVVLVARTNLRLHFKAVSLLHMFGATDEYILRQFQWNSAWLAARGALGGVVLAAFVFALAMVLSLRWQSPVLPEISLSVAHVLMFMVLPFFTALVAWLATRLTVQRMLEHMH